MALRAVLLVALMLLAARLDAEVLRVDITSKTPVGSSGYEKIVGIVHFAVDPQKPVNRAVVDLDKAPKGEDGRVTFSADLYILRPVDQGRSNGVVLVDILNRGRKLMLNGFTRGATQDPSTDADLGDGFLTRQGYTLAWVGWQFDVARGNGLMGIDVPRAAGVKGVVRAEFTPNDRQAQTTVADLAAYTPVDLAGPDTALTVRDGPFGKPMVVERGKWQLKGNVVSIDGGFEPGRVYQVAFRAENPPIAGLGLAAVRDVASWLRYGGAVPAPVQARHLITFGSSQSGRFLRTFLYHGFNADERDRQVFDGVIAHIAGAARLSLNERWATPNSLGMFDATSYPFADMKQPHPSGGPSEGLLDNDRARKHQPKIFYTNSSVEYWGGGRAAALVHTSTDGRHDLTLPSNVRAYLFSGTQHSPGRFPPRLTTGQQPENPVEYWWTMRALLGAMTRWVREDKAPPPSRYPRLADGTLVSATHMAFPRIPGVASPATISPARDGSTQLPLLVSAVDATGNETGGIRAPDVEVPLATYTGWNFRNKAIGGSDQLVSLAGSAIPLAKTRAEREAARDPRPSIAERYASRGEYVEKVRAAAAALVSAGYLLADDVPQVIKRSEEQWDLIAAV
jgi:hypothetical protein